MHGSDETRTGTQIERVATVVVFLLLLVFHAWGVGQNWGSDSIPGNGFRQSQTAITAMFVQREQNFSLAYPTPVLGKPWSVPFEFPLYQWTVVKLSDLTGMPLIQAGRAVSAACFYLLLPAVWLLLGHVGLERHRRLLVLGMVLSCPLYIFYSRAFLIETMALMFSLWFLQGFIAGVERRSARWILVANVAGIGAGLVKITTLLVYLVPAGLCIVVWLWRDLRNWTKPWQRMGWIAAALVLPGIASIWWVHFADAVKMLNPSSRNLVSATMHGYNFGTWSTRADPEIWAAHFRIFTTNVMSLPVLGLSVAFAVWAGRRWWSWIAGGIALSALAVWTFPILYAWHEYYWVASAISLLCAIGLALAAIASLPRWRWLGWAGALAIFGGQIWTYCTQLRPVQVQGKTDASPLTEALQQVTQTNDVLLIAGEDWSSVTPFLSGRRAFMIRRGMDNDIPLLREEFRLLGDEHVAAFVLRGQLRQNRDLLSFSNEFFDFGERPDLTVGDADVYFDAGIRAMARGQLRRRPIAGVELQRPGELPSDPWTGREVAWEELDDSQRSTFEMMTPRPFKFMTRFKAQRFFEQGQWFFDAHPAVRLWFHVTPGEHLLSMVYTIRAGAYEGLSATEATDGVSFAIDEVTAQGESRRVFLRVLKPQNQPADRGLQKLELRVHISEGSCLLVETNSAGTYRRDWAALGTITVK